MCGISVNNGDKCCICRRLRGSGIDLTSYFPVNQELRFELTDGVSLPAMTINRHYRNPDTIGGSDQIPSLFDGYCEFISLIEIDNTQHSHITFFSTFCMNFCKTFLSEKYNLILINIFQTATRPTIDSR